MFKNLLVPYDFSKFSRLALQLASRIQKHENALLALLHVIPIPVDLIPPDLGRQMEDYVSAIQARLEKELKSREGRYRVDVTEGDPASVLVKKIDRDKPDLVVMGSRGLTGLKHLLLGSVAEKAVRHSPSPVWVVRKQRPWPPKKILLPVDLSEFTGESLAFGAKLAKTFGAKLELLHVVSMLDLVPAMPNGQAYMGSDFSDRLIEAAKTRISKLLQKHRSLKINSHVVLGPVVQEISRYAQKLGVDFILIPTHGRRGVSHFFMGSVAEAVVRYAHCDVLSFSPKKMHGRRRALLKGRS